MLFLTVQLLTPIIAIAIALVFFKRKMAWWEFFILLFAPIIVTFIGRHIDEKIQTTDVEYFSHQIVKIEYYEYWESYVHKTCQESYECNCRTVKRNNVSHKECSTCYRTVDCSYCDRNSAKWIAYTSDGKSFNVSSSLYNQYKAKWKNERFVELNRKIVNWGGCGDDGDAYVITWDGEQQTACTITTEHSYTNKVRVSSSVYNAGQLTEQELSFFKGKVYDYPQINNDQQRKLVGVDDWKVENYLQWWNGKYGKSKQINFYVWIYNGAENMKVPQEKYIRGANKNEYILLLGQENGKIVWCDNITFCEDAHLGTPLMSWIMQNKEQSLENIISNVTSKLEAHWSRKQFAEFNYLQMDVSSSGWVVCTLINLLLVCGLLFLFVRNEHDSEIFK